MCLQDLQLARSQYINEVNVVSPGAVIFQVLPRNESRVGFFVLGPSAGVMDICIGAASLENHAARIANTTTTNIRYFSLLTHGAAIILPVFINASLAAQRCTIYETYMPLDAPTLQRLAQQGKW